MTAAQHAAQGGAGQPKGGGEVQVDNRLPVLVLHAQGEGVAGNAGIVDENVDPASHRRLGITHELVGGIRLGEVRGERVGALAQFGGERFKRDGAGAGQRDFGALGMEGPCDSAADAAGSAGDERGLAGQIEHG